MRQTHVQVLPNGAGIELNRDSAKLLLEALVHSVPLLDACLCKSASCTCVPLTRGSKRRGLAHSSPSFFSYVSDRVTMYFQSLKRRLPRLRPSTA